MNEKWYFNGHKVRTTSYYEYLGLTVSCLMKWQKATHNLALKGCKALNVIRVVTSSLHLTDVKLLFSLFDKMVVPIILYGAETWGTEYRRYIERVQIKFCRHVLGVGSQAPDVAVLGECGRYPMYVQYFTKAVKFWAKLLCMNDDRISKQCYIMLKTLDETGRYNWVTDVKGLLCRYGFNYIWLAQELGDIDLFITMFKQRVKDCALQEWHSNVCATSKLSYYSEYKTLLDVERYLTVVPHINLRKCIARFRCSSHNLAVEKGRHLNIRREERFCTYCSLTDSYVVEDEFHFLVKCPLYTDLRQIYLRNVNNFTSHLDMIHLMSSKSTLTVTNLCNYLYESCKRRDAFLNT